MARANPRNAQTARVGGVGPDEDSLRGSAGSAAIVVRGEAFRRVMWPGVGNRFSDAAAAQRRFVPTSNFEKMGGDNRDVIGDTSFVFSRRCQQSLRFRDSTF